MQGMYAGAPEFDPMGGRRIDNGSGASQSRRRFMNIASKLVRRLQPLVLLWLAVLMTFSFRASAVEPASDPLTNSASANESLRSYLQVQEQLHATQLALERNRQETEALAEKNTAALEAKLKALETTLNTQKSAEWTAMQETVSANNRMMLKVGGAIAGVGFFILLATGYLQWCSVNRLAEVSAQVQSSRQTLPMVTGGAALLNGGTGQSQDRLFGALSLLEKRILQLENTAHPAIEAGVVTSGTTTVTNGHDRNGHGVEDAEQAHDSVLIAKGESFLNLDQPMEALGCFDEILKTDPDHGEALVKKGLALEALQRHDEALSCYDKAIAAHADLTIAYLQKGGLFNRLERYEEALQCYEQALHAQEKAHAV